MTTKTEDNSKKEKVVHRRGGVILSHDVMPSGNKVTYITVQKPSQQEVNSTVKKGK